ncbi:MAG: hypothetical protein LQ338_001758 [Usnochroma carphineum]|nr:MAG: hypothetical protein LQ338_001758 [Usnochroma carphineum]
MCDSYFVESHDDSARARRAELREHEDMVKKQTQVAIADDLSDLASQEYGAEILQHMERMEVDNLGCDRCRLHAKTVDQVDTLPDVASMDIQTEIRWFMRPYLLDFLIEAHTASSLLPETLFLAINLLDRYCSKRIVYKRHYQLVGSAALLIAAKYGDRKERVPTIKELRCMCCGQYDDDMFTQMEWHVLQTLGWNIGHPTIDGFLQLALEHLPYDPEVEHMACYISEISLFHKEFVSKRPSDIARASLALARCILDRPQALSSDWAAQYDSQILVTLSQHLHRPSAILSRKYSASQCFRVSAKLEEFLARQASIARCYTVPPTPPVAKASVPLTCQPVTPVKQPYLPSVPHGTLTPPITPNGDACFNGGHPSFPSARPPTPASMGQHERYYQLPPINQLPSMI